jgi:hypothetical protein
MRDFFIGVLLITCGCSWSSDIKKEVQVDDQTVWTEHYDRAKKTHQDATEFNSTTTKEEVAVVVETPSGGVSVVRVPRGKPAKLPEGAKVIGTVPLDTTKVEVAKVIGAKDTSGIDTGTKDKAEEKKSIENTEKEHDVGVSKTVYFVAISAIIVVLLSLFLYVRSFFPKKVV